MMDWLIGFLASVMISACAYWKRSLSGSGVLGAIIVGTIVYGAGNLGWYGLLLAFFLTSSLLTRWRHASKAKWEEGYDKTGRRDMGQVMANGGTAAVLCLLNTVYPSLFWYAAFLGIMASVTADTWATEIGTLSKQTPRSLLTGKKVLPGTSGGISLSGIWASLSGGCLIGALAWVCSPFLQYQNGLPPVVIGGVSGLIGSLADSLLGAVYQANYRCTKCNRLVERREHCGQPTELVHGYRLITNDIVNLASSIVGAFVSVALFLTLL